MITGNPRAIPAAATYRKTAGGALIRRDQPACVQRDTPQRHISPFCPAQRAATEGARTAHSGGSRSFCSCGVSRRRSGQIDGRGSLADRRAKLIPAGALPGGACRARLDGRLAADLLASRRCSAGGYGLRGEVVTEHGDPPVADAEDLHQRYWFTPSPRMVQDRIELGDEYA